MTLTDTLPDMAVDPELADRIVAVSQRIREAPVEERDRLIREAYAAGGGLREIARLAGLTHRAVRKIVDRA